MWLQIAYWLTLLQHAKIVFLIASSEENKKLNKTVANTSISFFALRLSQLPAIVPGSNPIFCQSFVFTDARKRLVRDLFDRALFCFVFLSFTLRANLSFILIGKAIQSLLEIGSCNQRGEIDSFLPCLPTITPSRPQDYGSNSLILRHLMTHFSTSLEVSK